MYDSCLPKSRKAVHRAVLANEIRNLVDRPENREKQEDFVPIDITKLTPKPIRDGQFNKPEAATGKDND